jgi:HEAT repeat protein
MTPDQRRDVLKRLNAPSQFVANNAHHDILRDPDPALIPGVIRTLKKGKRVYNRIEAAYALQFLRGTRRTIALERTISNTKENKIVRGFAAEALVNGHRKETHAVLLRNLQDPSKEIRFWSAYALGQIRERKALPMLRKLAECDHRSVKGWWSVSKEARDAIDLIESNGRRRCFFCPH